MAMTAQEKKDAQRVYQARYQRSAKGKAAARKKLAPGQPWRIKHSERLAVTRENSLVTGLSRARWTDEEDGILRNGRQQSIPYSEIALQLGRSQQSVQRRADVLGIPVKREKRKAPKPLVVYDHEVSQVQIDELHKYMRRWKAFTAVELRDHFRVKFGTRMPDIELRRMVDNLLKRDVRAGYVKCDGRRDCSALWHFIKDPLIPDDSVAASLLK